MADELEKKKLCFVIGPIGDENTEIRRHADWLLKGIIEPTMSEFSAFRVERADKISAPGMIDSQIINRLEQAELVIADMSLANANAFYELGIRHMRELPTVHMFQAGTAIPFDLKPHRAIPFSHIDPAHHVTARAELKAAIEECLKPGFVVDNPVTRARGYQNLARSATPEMRVLMDEMANLQSQVRAMSNILSFLASGREAIASGLAKAAGLTFSYSSDSSGPIGPTGSLSINTSPRPGPGPLPPMTGFISDGKGGWKTPGS